MSSKKTGMRALSILNLATVANYNVGLSDEWCGQCLARTR
jgi:hypothetical protein